MTWRAARDGDGHRVHIWEEKRGLREREGDTPGGFTRVIQSRLPASKKEGKGKKKHGLARQKQEGKKGELYLPLNEPPSFLSPSCDFSLSFSSLPLCFTYILNRSHSLSFPSLFFCSLSSSSPHLSHSDMFSRACHP